MKRSLWLLMLFLLAGHWCLGLTAKSHPCQPEPLTAQLSGP